MLIGIVVTGLWAQFLKILNFCICGIVGIVGAGRGIARCKYEAIFEYALVILDPYSSEGSLFCSSFLPREWLAYRMLYGVGSIRKSF